MKRIMDMHHATASGDAAVVLLTPADRYAVDREAERAGAPCKEINGTPILTSDVQFSCVVRKDLTVHALPW